MATKDPFPLDNLGFRQQALNKKVNDAIANNVDFTTVKDKIEVSEVDKFFKIDLAAKCKNVDYIIEILKSGDTLYATRALKKSQWLYDDEHSHIINPEYLHTNIFAVTSARVKRIILKTVAMRVRIEVRAIEFFKYCIQNNLAKIAFKYLIFTSESFKLDLMHNYKEPHLNKLTNMKINDFEFIIGKSFTLLEEYLEMQHTNCSSSILIRFRYLYPVNNVKYLELCEKYNASFDKQLSHDIMTKYKERVLAKPLYYIKNISSDILLKYGTSDAIKLYITTQMPTDAYSFWNECFLWLHSDHLEKIPHDEKFKFLKKTFCEKYPGEEFEMDRHFYTQNYYKFMTVAEREEWAWNQIKSDKQVLGVGKDYLWYKFINFKIAFEEVKKYVAGTKDPERRTGILNVLIHSARNNRELETLFKYYHRKHNNELKSHKEYFLETVLSQHIVVEFDESCWNTFYTLLLSVELFKECDPLEDMRLKSRYTRFKNAVLFYYILHEKNLSETLSEYLLNDFYPESGVPELGNRDSHSTLYLLSKVTEQKRQFVYDFLFAFYIQRIIELKNEPFTDEANNKIYRYSENTRELMNVFNPFNTKCDWKSPSTPIPKVRTLEILSTQLLRELRTDKMLVMDTLLDVKKSIENNPFNIDGFLKKVKIYFPDDVAKIIMLFEESLGKHNLDGKTIEACVKSIFELGDERKIVEFMKKYAPEKSKIDHYDIDPQQLRVQKAICRFACIPRPPVPLSSILSYMKGDYVQYCLHVFNTYPVILPPSLIIDFVKALIDAPVSIQKHSLRLVFKCFDVQKLKEISLNIWKNTNNISVRCVIYKGMFNRLVERNETELFDSLKELTLDLKDNDEKYIFDLIESNVLLDEYLGDYIKATWTALSTFKDKQPNIQRKCNLLSSIRKHIHLMEEEFVSQIVEDHVKFMFIKYNLHVCQSSNHIINIYVEKWKLTYTYISYFTTIKNATDKKLEIAHFIIKKCLEMWDETYDGKYIYKERIWDFFRQLKDNSLCRPLFFENSLPIFEVFLKSVESNVLLFESYILRWELQLAIANRKAVKNARQNFGSDEKIKLLCESLVSFGKAVGELVLNLVNENVYFIFHSEKVKDVICNNIKELLDVYAEPDVDQATYINKALITFTNELIEFEMVETYLLAIQILPSDCVECSSNEYQVVVDKIQKYNKPDVQYALYQKLHKYCKNRKDIL